MSSSKRAIWIGLRTLLSIILLSFLLWRVKLGEVLAVVRDAHPLYLVLALLSNLGVVFVSARRWWILLFAHRILLTFKRVLTIYFVGFFFNNFLPAGVGLDLTRAFYAARDSGKRSESLASVIVERVLGFLGLLFFALLALLFFLRNPEGMRFFLLILAGTGLILILTYVGLRKEFLNRFSSFCGRLKFLGLGNQLKKLYNSIYLYRNMRATSWEAVGYSILLHGLVVLDNYFIGASLGLDIPPLYYVAYIPMICIVSMVPISINGLGVREGSYVLLFSRAGVKSFQALSLSLVFFLIGVACSLIGGLLFPVLGKKRSEDLGGQSQPIP